MSPEDVAELLAVCASFDGRTVDRPAILAWSMALSGMDALDAREACLAHYRESRQRLMPADLTRLVRARQVARRERRDPDALPSRPDGDAVDGDDLDAYLEALRDGRYTVPPGREPRGFREALEASRASVRSRVLEEAGRKHAARQAAARESHDVRERALARARAERQTT